MPFVNCPETKVIHRGNRDIEELTIFGRIVGIKRADIKRDVISHYFLSK